MGSSEAQPKLGAKSIAGLYLALAIAVALAVDSTSPVAQRFNEFPWSYLYLLPLFFAAEPGDRTEMFPFNLILSIFTPVCTGFHVKMRASTSTSETSSMIILGLSIAFFAVPACWANSAYRDRIPPPPYSGLRLFVLLELEMFRPISPLFGIFVSVMIVVADIMVIASLMVDEAIEPVKNALLIHIFSVIMVLALVELPRKENR